MLGFKFYRQLEKMDCGAACLRMIAKHHKISLSSSQSKNLIDHSVNGVSLNDIVLGLKKIGIDGFCIKSDFLTLKENFTSPCIVHWNANHFVVVYKIEKYIYIADPAYGKYKISEADFIKSWTNQDAQVNPEGYALVIDNVSKNPLIEKMEGNNSNNLRLFTILSAFLSANKGKVFQLILGLIVVSGMQLLLPFLNQSIIDIGVALQDRNILILILFAQIFIFLGKLIVEIVRSSTALYLSGLINVKFQSTFVLKLCKLPISYFEKVQTSDIFQKMADLSRIESLIADKTITILFSLVNFILFGIVLFVYSTLIFKIYLFGTIIYIIWVLLFLKKRGEIDQKRFEYSSTERTGMLDLVLGIYDLKLTNALKLKQSELSNIRLNLFSNKHKGLKISQIQLLGSTLINESKNVIITYIMASEAINGTITIGMMLSIAFIIGQLNNPLSGFIEFIYVLQDAKLSFERIKETLLEKNETHLNNVDQMNLSSEEFDLIELSNVGFKYPGSYKYALSGIDLKIYKGETIAIVGKSGCGKTTLIKLLLGFYTSQEGKILINNKGIEQIGLSNWRGKCGVVLQDGFIFNDTIAYNIALGDSEIDNIRLYEAIEAVNLTSFINELPYKHLTKIGTDGNGLSGGQKQRILIARAIYKQPDFLFFDEATSALDTDNEKIITQNLNKLLKGTTKIIIAHRLSTIKNADKIILLDNGIVLECGTHEELMKKGKYYFELVSNQLN